MAGDTDGVTDSNEQEKCQTKEQVSDYEGGISADESRRSVGKKKKKKRGARAQNVEEVFSSLSTVQACGLNPPPSRIVLTPRSAEACLKCGVNPETLRIRDLESFKENDMSAAVQRLRHEAYSHRRHEQMKLVRNERKRIIIAEEKSPSKQQIKAKKSPDKVSAVENDATSTAIDLEQRRLKKIQMRQQREIEQMLEFELKMNRIQEDAIAKMETERKRQEKLNHEKKKKAQLLAEQRRQRELQKKAEADAEEEKRRMLASEMFAKDKENAEARKKLERIRRIEARNREEERNRKAEEHRQQTQMILKKQQEDIMRRMKELETAEDMRNRMMQEQRAQRAREMEERRRKVEKRIKKNIKQARSIERRRKREFLNKQHHNDMLRQAMEQEKEEQRIRARQQHELLEQKRLMVLEEAREEENKRKKYLMEKQTEVQKNVQKVQESQKRQLELKKEQKLINHQLKMDNVERIKRINEYKRLETMRKLEEANERTDMLLQQKQQLISKRKNIAIKTKIQRDAIMQTMEKVKVTKKWDKATVSLNKVLSKDQESAKSCSKFGPQSARDSSVNKSESLPTLDNRSHTATSAREAPPEATELKFVQQTAPEVSPAPYMSPYELVPDNLRKKGKKKKKKVPLQYSMN